MAEQVPSKDQLRLWRLRVERYGGMQLTKPESLAMFDEIERLRRSLDLAIKGEICESCLARVAPEPPVDWKSRAEEAEGILNHNMALANANARRAQGERNAIICKMRERYSAMEIADMVGLTRQRVHQILNEAPLESESSQPPGDVG